MTVSQQPQRRDFLAGSLAAASCIAVVNSADGVDTLTARDTPESGTRRAWGFREFGVQVGTSFRFTGEDGKRKLPSRENCRQEKIAVKRKLPSRENCLKLTDVTGVAVGSEVTLVDSNTVKFIIGTLGVADVAGVDLGTVVIC